MITSRIESLIQPELLLFLFVLGSMTWLAYKLLLRTISQERHDNLRRRFLSLLIYFAASFALAETYQWLRPGVSPLAGGWLGRAQPYVGLMALTLGAVTVTRLAQLILYVILFRANMTAGVPRLLVNLFTLVFGAAIFGWLASEVYGVRLGPLLATSAAFSLILGLALQDTLGNLFAGVALQIDRLYRLGDWIEVQNDTQRWVGQIHEITWRATLLTGYMGELISIPNRVVAQSQVTRFSHRREPVRRGQAFRFGFDAPEAEVRRVLLAAAQACPMVLRAPAPACLIIEAAESWVLYKVFYSIADAESQYRVGDQVISGALAAAQAAGLRLAAPRMDVRVGGAAAGP